MTDMKHFIEAMPNAELQVHMEGSRRSRKARGSGPPAGWKPALRGARGPGPRFVRDQDKIWGGPLLTAGSGASCEEGTFLASRGQVSENGDRSFHIPMYVTPRNLHPHPARRTASW